MAVSGYTRLHRFEENQCKVYKSVHKLAAGHCPNTVASIAQLYIMFLQFTYCRYFRTRGISYSDIHRLQYFTHKPISAPPIFCKSVPFHSPIGSLCYLVRNTRYMEPQYADISNLLLKIFTFFFEKFKVEELIKKFPANCAILGYYPASSGNFTPTVRDSLSVPHSAFKNSYLPKYR
jgi:hypothetical protein